MESLIAIAVFALGFVAVAAIFPVAITMQKGAAGDLLAQQVARNVEAMLKSRKFSHDDLTDNVGIPIDGDPPHPMFIPVNLTVQPVLKTTSPGNLLDPPGVLQWNPRIYERWMLNDRSYFFVRNNVDTDPTANSNAYHPIHAAELGDPYADEFKRTFYWVPLIRRTTLSTGPSDWQVYVFILRRDDATYDRSPSPFSNDWANHDGFRSSKWYVPGVRSLDVASVTNPSQFNFNNSWTGINPGSGLEIVPGDLVLDSNGVRHTVLKADAGSITVNGTIPRVPAVPDKLWYARPAAAGRPSPTRQILILTDVVE